MMINIILYILIIIASIFVYYNFLNLLQQNHYHIDYIFKMYLKYINKEYILLLFLFLCFSAVMNNYSFFEISSYARLQIKRNILPCYSWRNIIEWIKGNLIFLIYIFKWRRNIHSLLHRKAKSVCLSGSVIRVQAQRR